MTASESHDRFLDPKPLDPVEAFSRDDDDAVVNQAAFLMTSGLALGGYFEALDDPEPGSPFRLPEARALAAGKPETPETAIERLGISYADHVAHEQRDLIPERGPGLAEAVLHVSDAAAAAELIEAGTHSPNELVRVAAATAATTAWEARPDLVGILEQGCSSETELTRGVAMTALARLLPGHPLVAWHPGEDPEPEINQWPTNTAFITHGTVFFGHGDWWAPGGDFYDYVDTLSQVTLHHQSFMWSGAYTEAARATASVEMFAWLQAQQFMDAPDILAHSHGGTVAHLTTQNSPAVFDRVILMSWPVHQQWLPVFGQVNRVISFRVKHDLVIMADRGGQKMDSHPQVSEYVNQRFNHFVTHSPRYWQRHDLPQYL